MNTKQMISQMFFPFAVGAEGKKEIADLIRALDSLLPDGAPITESWFPASLVAKVLATESTRVSKLVESGVLRQQKVEGHSFIHFGDALKYSRERRSGRPVGWRKNKPSKTDISEAFSDQVMETLSIIK